MNEENKSIENISAQQDTVQSAAPEEPKKKREKTGNGRKKMPKNLLAVIISVVLVLCTLFTVLIVGLVRNNRPPELETVRERLIALIETSYEVNEIVFGDGLPTFPRIYEDVDPFKVTFEGKEYTSYYFTFEDETYGTVVAYQYYIRRAEGEEGNKNYVCYDVFTGNVVNPLQDGSYRFAQKTKKASDTYLYHNEKTGYYYIDLPDYKDPEFIYEESDDKYYDYVRADSPYRTTDDIKDKVSQVYSGAYLVQIYENLFTGVAFSDGEDGVLYARYRDYQEDGYTYLQKSNLVKGLDLPGRRYDFSTMKMTGESKSKYIVIEIESYIPGEEERLTVELAFALENGNWYLDSPSY
jgi:hypothetical protein